MTILADECVNIDVIDALKSRGFQITDVRQAGLRGASDTKIFSYAIQNKYVLLTFDKDFGNILRFDIEKSAGVVIVYVEDMNKEEILKNSLDFFEKFTESQLKRRLFIIERNRLRILPK